MSYILDALRKSDEERMKHQDREKRPYSPYARTRGDARKKRITAGLLISAALLLIIALLGGGWWFSSRPPAMTQDSDSVQSPDAKTVSAPRTAAPDSPAAPAALPPLEPASSLPSQASAAPGSIVEAAPESDRPPAVSPAAGPRLQTSAETGTMVETGQIMGRDQLPLALQAALPELKFSGHAYSAAPELRLIMINQTVVREGELIAPDLRLEEITENGLIMNFRGNRFSIELF